MGVSSTSQITTTSYTPFPFSTQPKNKKSIRSAMNSFKLSRSACTGLIRAPPAALRPLRTPLRLICVKSVPENTTAASAAANSSIAAASDTQPAPPTTTAQPDRPNVSSSDRKPKRKSNRQQPATVLESGVAASAGALPDVLSATWPAKFPTLSAARRGELGEE